MVTPVGPPCNPVGTPCLYPGTPQHTELAFVPRDEHAGVASANPTAWMLGAESVCKAPAAPYGLGRQERRKEAAALAKTCRREKVARAAAEARRAGRGTKAQARRSAAAATQTELVDLLGRLELPADVELISSAQHAASAMDLDTASYLANIAKGRGVLKKLRGPAGRALCALPHDLQTVLTDVRALATIGETHKGVGSGLEAALPHLNQARRAKGLSKIAYQDGRLYNVPAMGRILRGEGVPVKEDGIDRMVRLADVLQGAGESRALAVWGRGHAINYCDNTIYSGGRGGLTHEELAQPIYRDQVANPPELGPRPEGWFVSLLQWAGLAPVAPNVAYEQRTTGAKGGYLGHKRQVVIPPPGGVLAGAPEMAFLQAVSETMPGYAQDAVLHNLSPQQAMDRRLNGWGRDFG